LSKGTLALSFDDKFIEQKNFVDIRNKPKTFKDGFRKGLFSASNSIKSGMVGMINKPIEGF